MAETRGARNVEGNADTRQATNTDAGTAEALEATSAEARADVIFKLGLAMVGPNGVTEETFCRILEDTDRQRRREGTNTRSEAVVDSLRSTSPDFAEQWDAGDLPKALKDVEAAHRRMGNDAGL